MASLMDTVMQSLGGDARQQLGQQLGLDPGQVQSALGAAVPTLLAGLANQAAQPGGAQALMAALDRNHDGSVLDDVGSLLGGAPGTLGGASSALGGANLLGNIFGGQHDLVHVGLARHTGLTPAQIASIMAIAAPVVMAAVSRMKQQQGLDHSGLAQALGNEHQTALQASPGLAKLASMFGDAPGGGAPGGGAPGGGSPGGGSPGGGGLGGLLGSLLGGNKS